MACILQGETRTVVVAGVAGCAGNHASTLSAHALYGGSQCVCVVISAGGVRDGGGAGGAPAGTADGA